MPRPSVAAFVIAALACMAGMPAAGQDRPEQAMVEVRGISAGDLLNLRATASPTGIVLGRLPNGTALRLGGCDKVGGYRWCRVEVADESGLVGWTPARYLYDAGTDLTMDETLAAREPADGRVAEGDGGRLVAMVPPEELGAELLAPRTRVGSGPDLTRTALLSALAAREGPGADMLSAFDGRREAASVEAARDSLALSVAARVDPSAVELYTLAPAARAADPEAGAATQAGEGQPAPGIPIPTPRPDFGSEPAQTVAALPPAPADDAAGAEPAPEAALEAGPETEAADTGIEAPDIVPVGAAPEDADTGIAVPDRVPVGAAAEDQYTEDEPADVASTTVEPSEEAAVPVDKAAAESPIATDSRPPDRVEPAPGILGAARALVERFRPGPAAPPADPATPGMTAEARASEAPPPDATPAAGLPQAVAALDPSLDPARDTASPAAATRRPEPAPDLGPQGNAAVAPGAAGGDGTEPAAPAVVAQAPAAAARFDATIPCARYLGQPMTRCEAGVMRTGPDAADITVHWPDGGTRIIRFRDGEPEGANGRGAFRATREADLHMIRVGQSERFEILDALAFGEY